MQRIWFVVTAAALIGCGSKHPAATVPPPPPAAAQNQAEEPKPQVADTQRTGETGASTGGETRTTTLPPPPPPPPEPKAPASVEEINAQLKDVYFEYDRFDPDAPSLATLRSDAQLLATILREFPNMKVIVEGHCDDRGSAEYNIGLGERRASRVLDVLREYGLPAGNTQVVSYGKEAPQCVDTTDACRRSNRRAHMVVQ